MKPEGTASFAVTRINGSAGTRSATCSTVDLASATPGLDYGDARHELLNWADGDTSTQYCQVAILPDGVPEGSRRSG
ncbi:MAG: hypothetical protein IPI85_11280 [Dehalococcoidia bacterium]|nr:hypothetical protein [Dehalococcoidia bacterium]